MAICGIRWCTSPHLFLEHRVTATKYHRGRRRGNRRNGGSPPVGVVVRSSQDASRMTRHIYIVALFVCCSCSAPAPPQSTTAGSSQPLKWGLVIHTGAGNFTLAGIAERQDEMQAAMNEALMAGYRVLAGGGTSLARCRARSSFLKTHPCSMRARALYSRTKAPTSSMRQSWTAGP